VEHDAARDGTPAVLQSRCIDETGYTQPTLAQLVAIRGSNGPFGSIYHLLGCAKTQKHEARRE
jgi:hypothetical protein